MNPNEIEPTSYESYKQTFKQSGRPLKEFVKELRDNAQYVIDPLTGEACLMFIGGEE